MIAIVLDSYHMRAEVIACGIEGECREAGEEWAWNILDAPCSWIAHEGRLYAEFADCTIWVIGNEFDFTRIGEDDITLMRLW